MQISSVYGMLYQDGQSHCGSSLTYTNDLLRMKHSNWREHSDKCASTNRVPLLLYSVMVLNILEQIL